ncbi:MAG: CHAP domain-containing protein [Clostridia bacterium]|nr:CHAP domain-containing protein [Clostridia bacterium]
MENAKNAGIQTGPLPAADSVAVWGGTGDDYGHVAYVEDVNGDVITISEANYTWENPPYPCYDVEVGASFYNGTKDLDMNSLINRYPYGFLGFIYLYEIPAFPQAAVDRGKDGVYFIGEDCRISLENDTADDCTLYIYRAPEGDEPGDSDYTPYLTLDLSSGEYTLTHTEPGYYCCGYEINKYGYVYQSLWTQWRVSPEIPVCIHKWGQWGITKIPGCEEPGYRMRECSECGEREFETISPSGHRWGEPAYQWNEHDMTVTATSTCRYDISHIVTETVGYTSEIIRDADYDTPGMMRLTSYGFSDPLFTVQTKEEEIPPLEGAARFSLSDVSGTWGRQVSVYLSASSDMKVSDISLGELQFDTVALEFLGFAEFGDTVFQSVQGASGFSGENASAEISFEDPVKLDGILCALVFRIKDGSASGDHAVAMTAQAMAGDRTFDTYFSSGNITVTDFVPGDIDCDGSVSINDVIALLQHMIFPDVYMLNYAGTTDLNNDGGSDINDVVALLQYSIFPEIYDIFS